MTRLMFYFLLRNKVKYEIIILLFLTVYNFIQSEYSMYGIIYSITLIIILYIVYFNVLARQKGRVNLLYNGTTVKHLKSDIIKSVSILSISLLGVVVLVDLFLLNAFYLTLYHMGTLIVFVLSTLLVSINIEKRNSNSKKILTFKEGVKVVGLGLVLYLIFTLLLVIL